LIARKLTTVAALAYLAITPAALALPSLSVVHSEATAQAEAPPGEHEFMDAQAIEDSALDLTPAQRHEIIRLYEISAGKGYAMAHHNLGVWYHYGIGTNVDYHKAFDHYLAAAQLGFAGAMNNLGDMYESGQGVHQSYGDAIRWYASAAEQGEPVAHYSLGSLYLTGKGVRQDYAEAAFWLQIALKRMPQGQNREATITSLNEALRQLSNEEAEFVSKRIEQWEPLVMAADIMSDRIK